MTADAEPVRVLVLANCGHWWAESRPAAEPLRSELPRVCSCCLPTVPAAVGASPQGFAMVPVTYIVDWTEERP